MSREILPNCRNAVLGGTKTRKCTDTVSNCSKILRNGTKKTIKLCTICQNNSAAILRPKTLEKVCQACFLQAFETEIHDTITANNLFHRGEKIGLGASGGKDSTVLIHVMTTLNRRYDYGLDLHLISVDEGIKGYRDDSLETVKRNKEFYKLSLNIVSYKELYGWSMDEIVAMIGKKNNWKRQALDRCAQKLDIAHILTGHNADDAAETVLMNLLRGDIGRLPRSTDITTYSSLSATKRSKPLIYAYEKEIVMYAHFLKLDYFSTECTYSPEAFRGTARSLIKDIEKHRPSSILDIIFSGEAFRTETKNTQTKAMKCTKCGYISSNPLCKACNLIADLAANMSKVIIDS